MRIIRQLPEQNPRVETGVVQFGGDWPGIFIRGDQALAASLELKFLGELLSSCEDGPGVKVTTENFMDLNKAVATVRAASGGYLTEESNAYLCNLLDMILKRAI